MREERLDMRPNGFSRYGQRKPDVADWTYGAHSVIPDNSTNSLQANGGLRVEFSLSKIPIIF